ncbi:HAMP domain-containing histidine kinase [Rhodobacteraceae bacterium B1Z28]|uniref:histidine kinase n=1 Tax=Ruegeria haliotis TaxID=2747601 RepID=A0ABX2PUV5_9RHOB|nr:HAMP domain-containing sensor histidine kinase [Ruegeria haliotis]NVO57436.1 HAMP domain-containing histidine kinase [Ruegeria haliotis]
MTKLLRRSALRQSLVLSGVFLMGLLVAGTLVLLGANGAVERQLDQMLMTRHALLAEDLRETPPEVIFPNSGKIQPRSANFEALVTDDGTIYGQLPTETEIVTGLQTILFKPRNEKIRNEHQYFWRAYSTRVEDGNLIVGTRADIYNEAVELLPLAFLISAGLIILVVLGGGLWFATRNQARLDRIHLALDRIAAGDLDSRINVTHPVDDLDDLSDRVDDTAERIALLMGYIRQSASGIAHDLKTPLTRLGIRVETLADAIDRGSDPTEDLAAVQRQISQMSQIFSLLLRIAEIERGSSHIRMQEVDLGALAEVVADIYQAVIEDEGGSLRLELDAPALVWGNEALLVQALSNLMENALRHGRNPESQRPVVTLSVVGSALCVRDSGPGIAPEHHDEALVPMKRLDDQVPGYGLGLALVNSVANLHRARLVLDWANCDRKCGLSVCLHFTSADGR